MAALAGQVRRFWSVSVLVAAGWVIPHVVEACSCLPPGPPQEAFEYADAVFEGRAAGVEDLAGSPLSDRRFEFEVLRQWKGELPATVAIRSAASGAACGRSFEIGEIYLIYASAHPDDDDLRDNLCSRTRPLGRADEDLAVLGAGTTPVQAAPPSTPSDREPPRIVAPPLEPPPTAPPRRGCRVVADGDPSRTLAALLGILALAAPRRRWRRRSTTC